MGRGKSASLSLIQDRRKRLQTFEKRKKGLEKKVHELSTLCDVNMFMIMLGPEDVFEGTKDPIIWPNDPNVAHRMICLYQDKQKTDKKCTRNATIASIFQDQVRIVEKEVEKLKKQNMLNKYPTWDKKYDSLSVDELLQFGYELDNVLQVLKSRSDSMKTHQLFQGNKDLVNYHPMQGLNYFNCFGNALTHQVFQTNSSRGNRGTELEYYHTYQGLNSFNCFGNEGALVLDNFQAVKVLDESSSYYNNYNNNNHNNDIVPDNFDHMDESLSYYNNNNDIVNANFHHMGESSSYINNYNNNNDIVPANFHHMGESSSYYNNYNNNNDIVPANLDHMISNTNYYCPSMAEFGENFVQNNSNVLMGYQENQYQCYAPQQGQMQVFTPCPLSSVDTSQMVHGEISDRSTDQSFGNFNFH